MTIEILERGTFVEFRAFGATTKEEIVQVSWDYHRETPKRLCVWDFRQANVSALKAENFKTLEVQGAEIASFRGNGARNAILLRDTTETVLASAFSGMTNAVSKVENEVFLDRDEAIAWLTDASG
ncbi:hypothetical protein NUH88_20840 [Nisaea acidiphila]|uniref:STAS/SEC14 domain-containing protein n=1 Tax=Nisaea acidiphila TaxID=1862145 RepID=A0A9J7AU32_9PROT|nr:hypothetical protein [Nisaea acidiphila]UUX49828.1 hypothetical protein NUH88_20840 [Nisaea acidiphila]